MLRAEGSPFWPITLTDHAEQLLALYAEQRDEMDYWLAHAVGEANDADFSDRMMRFLDWIEAQKNNAGLSRRCRQSLSDRRVIGVAFPAAAEEFLFDWRIQRQPVFAGGGADPGWR